MPREKDDVVFDIMKLTGSYSGGVCLICKKKMKEGSEKMVNGYDIHWGCYDDDADPINNRLMALLNEHERLTK